MPFNETEIIDRYFRRSVTDESVAIGIGDDAAVIAPEKGQQLVVTTDTMIEGHHFFPDVSPRDLGYKIFAINLSDIAAMGARPRWVTLNLTLPQIDPSWLQAFSEGFFELADLYNVSLIGGDTCRGDNIALSVQLIGSVPEEGSVRRSGAMPKQSIYVTGTLGAAAYNLKKIIKYNKQAIENEYNLHLPTPRVEVGLRLRDIATAMTDVSDGLLLDLNSLCEASEVYALLCLDNLPVYRHGSNSDPDTQLQSALVGGEDYELLFTCDEKHADTLKEIASETGCLISCIGETKNKAKHTKEYPICCTYRGEPFPLPDRLGFDHFTVSS